MQKIIILLAVLVLSSGLLYGQEMKIGVVNSELVMQSYPEFRRAEEQLGREVEAWQKDRVGWETEMTTLQETIIDKERRLEAGQTTFSDKRKTEMSNEIDSLRIAYQQNLEQQMAMEQEKFNQRRMELYAEVLEVVNQTIEDIGETQGYDLILDGANGTIVYAKDPNDITDELLKLLEDK